MTISVELTGFLMFGLFCFVGTEMAVNMSHLFTNYSQTRAAVSSESLYYTVCFLTSTECFEFYLLSMISQLMMLTCSDIKKKMHKFGT